GGAARHLEEDALRRDDEGWGDTPPQLRAIPRLPPPRRGRALAGRDPRFPGLRLDQPRPRTFRPRLRDREGRPRAPRGGPLEAARVGREDPRRRPRPADQGDLLLGPPRRGTTPPGGGRQVPVTAELGGGAQACRRAAGAAAEEDGPARPRGADLRTPAGRPRRTR